MTATDFVRVETLIDAMATERPDHPAIIFGDRRWTYGMLRTEMDRRAAMLVAAGLQRGEIVATTVIPDDDLIITFLACCRAALPLLCLSPSLTNAEGTPLLERASVKVVLTADGRPHPAISATPSLPLGLPGVTSVAATQEAAHRSATGTAEAIAIIQLTSGTTGSGSKLVQYGEGVAAVVPRTVGGVQSTASLGVS